MGRFNWSNIFRPFKGVASEVFFSVDSKIGRMIVSSNSNKSFFFSECADIEQLERQVLRARFLGLIPIFDFYQQSDAGIETGMAG